MINIICIFKNFKIIKIIYILKILIFLIKIFILMINNNIEFIYICEKTL